MIRVLNLREYVRDVDEVIVRVDRSSILGNKFKMKNNSLEERNRVCDEYYKYFMKNVKKEGEFRNEVIKIYRMVKAGKKVALGCWCYPKRCHAEIIKEFIEGYISPQQPSKETRIVKRETR